MKKKPLSKTRLRLGKMPQVSGSEYHPARIEELFPEIPDGVDDILFDVSAEPLFPNRSSSSENSLEPHRKKIR